MKKKQNKPNVILVGSAEEMYGLWLDLTHEYEIKGIFSNDVEFPSEMKKVGEEGDALPYVKENASICAIFCHMNSNHAQELYLYSRTSHVEFFGVPPFMPVQEEKIHLSKLGKTILLSTEKGPTERNLRYALRFPLCLILFLTLIPLLCIPMAIVIKRKSSGPILSFQKKIGRMAKEHTLVSFRGFEKYCFDTHDAKFILTK